MADVVAQVVDTSSLPPKKTVRLEQRRTILEAKSLANVLNVIKRRLASLQTERVYTREDIMHYQHMLEQIDQRWRDASGTFAGRLSEVDPKTQALVSRLFNECWDLLDEMESSAVEMAPEVTQIYHHLAEMKSKLLTTAADPAHTLAETLELQKQLDSIDATRVHTWGALQADAGSEASATPRSPRAAPLDSPTGGARVPGVAACNELLNACYEVLADCLRSAQDVGPEMQDLYDRLRSIKNALRKLRGRRHHTLEDLQYYQGLLAAIDSARKGGVFCGDAATGRIPHGQAAAASLLQECYDLIEDLANSATDMSPEMRAVHETLERLRHRLEGLASWAEARLPLAELEAIQEQLNDIDDQRAAHAGVFAYQSLRHEIPAGQAVCSSLLNLCYRDLHELYAEAVQQEEGEEDEGSAGPQGVQGKEAAAEE